MEDEAKMRAVMREEITLAMKTLATAAENSDVPYETGELESSALRAVQTAANRFLSEYPDACEWTDGERKRLTDPFTGKAPDVASCDHIFWENTCQSCGARRPHRHEYAWDREACQMLCAYCGQPEE